MSLKDYELQEARAVLAVYGKIIEDSEGIKEQPQLSLQYLEERTEADMEKGVEELQEKEILREISIEERSSPSYVLNSDYTDRALEEWNSLREEYGSLEGFSEEVLG